MGDWYDLGEIAQRFNVAESAVREAAGHSLAARAGAMSLDDLHVERQQAFRRFGESLGAPDRLVVAAVADAVGRRLTDLLETMYAGGGTVDHARFGSTAASVGVDHARAGQLVDAFAHHKLRPLLDSVLDDNLLTPEEDATVAEVMARIGLDRLDPSAESALQGGRDLWQAAAGPLPVIQAPVLLKRGEACHHLIAAQAVEDRQRTVSVRYGGPSARIRIAKGLSYSVGSRSISRRVESYHHSWGRGVLCTTNKRLLWVSPDKTLSFSHPSIVMTEPFRDGLLVRRTTGKPVTFIFDADDRAAVVLISRVVAEVR